MSIGRERKSEINSVRTKTTKGVKPELEEKELYEKNQKQIFRRLMTTGIKEDQENLDLGKTVRKEKRK